VSLAQLKNTGDLEGLLPIGVSTTSMLAYYPMVDGLCNDYSGNGLNGTVLTQTATTDRYGRANRALYFDGSNVEGISIPLTSTTKSYSFSMWVKAESKMSDNYQNLLDIQNGRIILNYRTTASDNIAFHDNSVFRYFGVCPSYNTWHHLAFIVNDITNTVKLYVDGSQYGSSQTYSNGLNIGGTVKIGSRYAFSGTWLDFKGSISEFAIWERIITDDEIAALYNGQKAEFSEISYAGKGDGLGVYIDTLIPANTIDSFEITFKFKSPPFMNAESIFGSLSALAERFHFSYSLTSGYFNFYIANTDVYFALLPYVVNGVVYKVIITKNSSLNYNLKLYRISDNVLLYDESKQFNGVVSSSTVSLFCKKYLSSYQSFNDNTIYSFTINSETWYINNGTGNTITGSLGTVLTVNGTLTNFWQQSTIWNEDANLKMYQGNPSYYGSFNGTNNYVDMGFKPVDITATKPFEIKFKMNNITCYYYDCRDVTPNVFALLNLSPNIRIYYGVGTTSVAYAWSLFTVGEFYKLQISVVGTDYLIKIFDSDGAQIGTTQTVAIPTVTLPNNNIKLSVWLDYLGGVRGYYSSQIAYIKGNGQEWYFNSGSGALLTGNLGTQLTINGTLTNFWQVADFWNKPLNEGLVKCNEFDEVSTTYTGKGDGASIYIDTGIPANTIDNFEIIFKHETGLVQYLYNCRQGTNVFGLLRYVTPTYYRVFYGNGELSIDSFTYSLFTVGDYYRLVLNTVGTNWQISMYHINGTQVGITYTVAKPATLPIYNVHLFSTMIDGTKTGYYAHTLQKLTINSETWNISRGYGNTITGDKGTVLNISGTLHNFWQINTRSVEQYCGKGNGTNLYIDTNILPKDVNYFKIRKTYNITSGNRGHGVRDTSSSPTKLFLITTISPNDREYFYIGLSANTTATAVSALVENQIYDYIIERTSDTVCNCKVIDMDGVVKLNSNITFIKANIDAIIQTIKIGFVTAYSYTFNKVYSFQINDEIWYLNQGTGTSITGSLGTVLTVSGTTTSFWQPSEIWNDPAQMKLLENELDIKNEIVEI